MAQVIKKVIIRTFLFIPVIALVLVISLLALLQIPAVQTKIAQKAADQISQALQFPISIDYVSIHWFDRALLKGVQIVDREHNKMIDVPQLAVDFEIASLLGKGNINLDEVILTEPHVRLIISKQDSNLNIDEFIYAINDLTRPKDTTRSGKVPVFSIDRVRLENAYFSYVDERRDTITDGFDYNHIVIDSINAKAFNFRLAADTIEIDIDKLTGIDPVTHLNINELSTFFRYTKTSIQMENLYTQIGNSVIRDFVAFKYASPADFSDFNNKITMIGHLNNTSIASEDLALFAPYLHRYKERWNISGDFKGKVVRFRLQDANLSFGEKSFIKGYIGFDGLPNFEESFINLDLQQSVVEPKDLRQYIVDEEAYNGFKKFGTVNLKGKFLGFPNDFVANGSFDTRLGKVVSDINLKLKEDQAQSTYTGKLSTYAFNIGELFNQPELHLLDMNGKVQGRGFSLEDASANLNATVKRIGINKYDYRNIKVNGKLSRQQFKGNVAIRDTNLVLAANGEIDLRKGKHLFDIKADLERANLKELNFFNEEATIRTKLNVNIQGLAIDDIVGEATFTNASVLYNNRELILDSLHLFSSKSDTNRVFNLHSDFVSGSIQGKFDFTRAFKDIERLAEEYRLNFVNNEAAAESYYLKKNVERPEPYQVYYEAQIKDINPVLTLIFPDLYVSKNTKLEGSFSNGVTSMLSLNSKIDSLSYKDYKFFGAQIDVASSKLADSPDVLASAYIHADQQQLGTVPQTESLDIEAIWANEQIEFTSNIKQTNSTNYGELNGFIRFLSGKTQIHFNPSQFSLLDNIWKIAPNNLITIRGREITFDNLQISNQFQLVSLNGVISDSVAKAAELRIRDFNMQTLNPILGRNLLGVTNGFIIFRDFYKNLNFESELDIEELVIDKFLIGNIVGQANWDNASKKVKVNYDVYRMNNQILTLAGTFDPNAEANSLNMMARLRRTDLVVLEPFFSSEVSNISGNASGTLRIGGTVTSPLLKGTLTVNSGRFRYNYLNTTYHFEDKVYFNENEIGVKQLQLMDDENNIALIRGGVFHDGFKNFVIDLQGNLNNFQVLNTTAKDNELFYGTAFATGDLSILGSINNLAITANATSNRGTKIFIPIGGYTESIEQEDYIQFISKKELADSLNKSMVQQLDLSGVKLDFNFDITSDAYVELIFDIRAGDIIRGNGNGKIRMEIDTKGDFHMFGDYVIEKGAYNFTLLNAINKEFKIRPGSKVSWFGDPYGGVLDIKATYEQTASLMPILNLNSEEERRPDYNRRYPVTVLLNLTGDLMSPDIDLGIEFNAASQNLSEELRTAIMNFESRIASNEQELNRQVFSLMILRKLSPEGTFSGIEGSVGNSLSELLSNQLSYWASQVDDNLEVDFDLKGLDEDAFNNFQVRLSYSFLDGRLRVTRDGNFNTQYQTGTQSLIGEWTVEYVLTNDGKLRLKMYNRNNQNALLSSINNTANTMAGVSIQHSETFNSLKELFTSKKKKKKKNLVAEEQENSSSESADKAEIKDPAITKQKD